MFAGITAVGPWLSASIDRELPWLGSGAWALKLAAVIAVSAGLYRSLLVGFKWLLQRSPWLRRQLLGKLCIEGTWVGRYRRNRRWIHTVEHIDQSTDNVQIQGWAFDEAESGIGNWTSEVAALNPSGTELTYAYRCDMSNRGHVHYGLGKFTLVRNTGKAPDRLVGYAADLPDGVKDLNEEVKVSSVNLPHSEALKLGKAKLGPG
jgi:hypothetical protein